MSGISVSVPLPASATGPCSLRAQGLVVSSKPLRAQQRTRYFSTATEFEESGRTRMSFPCIPALRPGTATVWQVEAIAIRIRFAVAYDMQPQTVSSRNV